MVVIPNSCRECNQHDCVNHQFEWFMKNNPNINNANSVNPACPLLKEVSQEPVIDKIRAEIEKQEKWLLQAGCNTYNVDIALDAIKSVVAESEE